jgi:hypothetical protein
LHSSGSVFTALLLYHPKSIEHLGLTSALLGVLLQQLRSSNLQATGHHLAHGLFPFPSPIRRCVIFAVAKRERFADQVRAGPFAEGGVIVAIGLHDFRALASKFRWAAGAADNSDDVGGQCFQRPTQIDLSGAPIQFALIVFDCKRICGGFWSSDIRSSQCRQPEAERKGTSRQYRDGGGDPEEPPPASLCGLHGLNLFEDFPQLFRRCLFKDGEQL